MAKARAARPPTILIQPKRWTEADAAAAFWMERIANTPAVSL